MRTAVLVTNYIVGVLLTIGLISSFGEPDFETTLIGCVFLIPAIVLALAYAHRTKG